MLAGGAPERIGAGVSGAPGVGDGNLTVEGVGDAGAADVRGMFRGVKSNWNVPAGRTGALVEDGTLFVVGCEEKNVVGLGEGLDPASVVKTKSSSPKVVELAVVAANGAALFKRLTCPPPAMF